MGLQFLFFLVLIVLIVIVISLLSWGIIVVLLLPEGSTIFDCIAGWRKGLVVAGRSWRQYLFSRLDLGLKIRYFFSPRGVVTSSFAKMEVSITLLHGVTNLGFEVLLGGLCWEEDTALEFFRWWEFFEVIGVGRVVQYVAKYFKNQLTDWSISGSTWRNAHVIMLDKCKVEEEGNNWLCTFIWGGKIELNKYLGNFFLEFRGKVVFKRYDDRIGGCNKGVFFDGSQAFDERNWGGQCPVY